MKTRSRSTLDDTTRVAATATRTTYDRTSIVLHWLTAILVLLLFVLAQFWGVAQRPTRHLMVVAHMSLGIVLAAVVTVRIVWRLLPGHEVEPAVSGWVERAARTVQVVLYALLVGQAVLGFLMRWAGNEAMSFFGLLIPPPFAELPRATRQLLSEAHEWIGWIIVVVALGHALAALYHDRVLHDDVLRRMLPGGARAPSKSR